MLRLRIFLSAILAGALTIVVPFLATAPASAAATTTKTIVVKDATGALLKDAYVSIGYCDTMPACVNWLFTTPQQTDASGTVVITGLPQDATWAAELNIDPAVTDNADAAYWGWANDALGWNLGADSTITVTLQPATFHINATSSAGTDVPLYTSISYAQTTTSWFNGNLLRFGKLGLYMDTSNPNWGSQFQLRPWNSTDPTKDCSFLGLMRVVNSAATIIDPVTNLAVASTAGAFNVKLPPTTFSYQIVDPTNLSSILPGKRLWVDYPDEFGNVRWFQFNMGGKIGLPVGTFKIKAFPAGNADSTFAPADYVAVVTNGGASATLYPGDNTSGTALTANAGLYSIPLAASNYSGRILDTNGAVIVPGLNQFMNITLMKQDVNGNFQYQYNMPSYGHFALNLTTAGVYKIQVQPSGIAEYTNTDSPLIAVTGTAPNLQISYGGAAPVSNLVQDFNLAKPNVYIKVLNPKTGTPINAGWIQVNKVLPNGESWLTNLNIDPSKLGVASGVLPDGSYKLFANPQPGDPTLVGVTQKIFFATVSGNGTVINLYEGTSAAGTPVVASAGLFTISLGNANVIGALVNGSGAPIGTSSAGWVNACLQQSMPGGGWNYLSCNTSDSTGHFAFSISNTGTFRIALQPGGRTDFATTYSNTFDVLDAAALANLNLNLGNITANPTNLILHVQVAGQNTNLNFANIQIQKDNQFYGWTDTSNIGSAPAYLPLAGAYKLIVNPPPGITGVTLRSYDVTVTGVAPALNISIAGVAANSDGSYTLPLGAATVSGTVMVPGGTTGVGSSQVVATDLATNRELWELSTGSAPDGSWSMYLPAGRYSIRANTPWGTTPYSGSDPLTTIVVDSSGAVTFTGAAVGAVANAIALHLNNPYWSGQIVNPITNAGLSNAHLCLNLMLNGQQSWACANSDVSGNWVMSKPAGFIAFDANSDLQVAENQNPVFAMADFRGAAAIEGTGFLAAGKSGIILHPNNPNVSIKVLAGSTPASNLWVNLSDSVSGTWLGGSSTDSAGISHFSASDLTHPFRVQIDTQGNPSVASTFAAMTKIYTPSEMTTLVVAGSFNDTITLSAPNVKGLVLDPVTHAPIQNAWVDLYNTTSNQWTGGTNTSITGAYLLNAAAPASGSSHYQLFVNPPWNSTSTSTRHTYSFDISSSNVVSNFKDDVTSTAVIETTTGYSISLSIPSVVGIVKDPTSTTAIPNSWVVPTNAAGNMDLWQFGSNSRNNGQFGLSLADGAYQVYANTPWGNSSYTASAKCAITVTAGQITGGGTCVQPDKSLVLPLRAPNYFVHVFAPDGVTPLQNVHVGIGLGMWNVNAQTDSSGIASLFIDPAQILSMNVGLTGLQNIWMWIDPPWGTSDYVRTQCYSGQASTACTSLPQVDLAASTFAPATNSLNVSLSTPNTHVTVMGPANEAIGAGSWVTIFSIVNGGWNWLAGSNTDSAGKAAFNLDPANFATGKYVVQVDAPWQLKATYSGKTYDSGGIGLDYVAVNNQTFNLTTPNLIVSVKDSSGSTPVYSGWIGVEKVNLTDTATIGWFNGFGLDQFGTTSISLPVTSRFKLTVYPAPGVAGVSTSCYVQTNETGTVSTVPGYCDAGSGVVSKALNLTLPTGNTSGTVTYAGSPVVGAIVYANIVNAGVMSSDPATAVVTSTNSAGHFSMQLDPALTWQITITPVNTPSDPVKLAATTLSAFSPNISVAQNATLALAP